MSVCIVDDNPVAVAQLRHLVLQAGEREVWSFTNPNLGLRWCMQTRPSLILLDYNMPGMDGLSFLQALHDDPDTSHIPVALISGWAVDGLKRLALEEGVVDVIEKPFDTDLLRLKVKNLLKLAAVRADPPHADDSGSKAAPGGAQRHATPAADDPALSTLDRLLSSLSQRPRSSLQRVGRFAAAIGHCYGLGIRDQDLIERAAVFVELGRWASSASGTLAAGKSGVAALAAYELLRHLRSDVGQTAATICLGLAERWDGTGGPQALAGERIPLVARIAAVADAFELIVAAAADEQVSKRIARAVAVIEAESGGQFDPEVVAAFKRALPSMIRLGDEGPDTAQGTDATPQRNTRRLDS
jgi:response regulator RpfG family c-di-GMP phosphodiesterase